VNKSESTQPSVLFDVLEARKETSMKTLASAFALLLAVACSSMPSAPGNEYGGSGSAGISVNPKTAPDFILLSSPGTVQTWDYTALKPREFYVRGMLTTHGFRAAGEIEGNGKLCEGGSDWFSLAELKVHTAAEGKSPVAPYILGCANGRGFQPASRAIVMQ
jgi:hypothetical protein